MKLLLDTHTLLWHSADDPRMSSPAAALLIDSANELFLSMATLWEIAIKVGLGKLTLSSPYISFMSRAISGYGLVVLPITLADCDAYAGLPFPNRDHRDPFDRMIITHAVRNGLSALPSMWRSLTGVTPTARRTP